MTPSFIFKELAKNDCGFVLRVEILGHEARGNRRVGTGWGSPGVGCGEDKRFRRSEGDGGWDVVSEGHFRVSDLGFASRESLRRKQPAVSG